MFTAGRTVSEQMRKTIFPIVLLWGFTSDPRGPYIVAEEVCAQTGEFRQKAVRWINIVPRKFPLDRSRRDFILIGNMLVCEKEPRRPISIEIAYTCVNLHAAISPTSIRNFWKSTVNHSSFPTCPSNRSPSSTMGRGGAQTRVEMVPDFRARIQLWPTWAQIGPRSFQLGSKEEKIKRFGKWKRTFWRKGLSSWTAIGQR